MNEIRACGQLLIEQKLTIAFAESATGGRATYEFSLLEDAGKFLKGGIVCYNACVKEDTLGVSKELIKKYTPESSEVTEAITRGLAKIVSSDIHIGITGLPAPGGSETIEKPVGTMFIYCLKDGHTLFNERITFKGTQEEIITQTLVYTAFLVKKFIKPD